jgi:hypothetical protein
MMSGTLARYMGDTQDSPTLGSPHWGAGNSGSASYSWRWPAGGGYICTRTECECVRGGGALTAAGEAGDGSTA